VIAGRDLVLACTLEPCVLCTGAAMAAGVDTIFYGLPAVRENGTRRVLPSETGASPLPRVVGDVLVRESRALLREYLDHSQEPASRDWARRLLEETADPPGE
jgi:tRNA(adenine34) deaminase